MAGRAGPSSSVDALWSLAMAGRAGPSSSVDALWSLAMAGRAGQSSSAGALWSVDMAIQRSKKALDWKINENIKCLAYLSSHGWIRDGSCFKLVFSLFRTYMYIRLTDMMTMISITLILTLSSNGSCDERLLLRNKFLHWLVYFHAPLIFCWLSCKMYIHEICCLVIGKAI